jgi:hypothetical protein
MNHRFRRSRAGCLRAICLKDAEEVGTDLPEAAAGDRALGYSPLQVALPFTVVSQVN